MKIISEILFKLHVSPPPHVRILAMLLHGGALLPEAEQVQVQVCVLCRLSMAVAAATTAPGSVRWGFATWNPAPSKDGGKGAEGAWHPLLY
jgi:hypothetical protein